MIGRSKKLRIWSDNFGFARCSEQSDNFVRTEFGTRAEGHSCAALYPHMKRVAADPVLLDN